MARIRTIKPEFWTSEQVMNLTRDARLAFLGLLNFSDDGGNHPASAMTLKAQVFPGDNDLNPASVQGFVQDMHEQRLLVTYQGADGADYWHVTGWDRHQRIDRPSFRYPPFGEPSTNPHRALDESSTNPRHPFTEPSTSATPRKGRERKGRERKGMEGNGMEGNKEERPPQRAPRGSRLPSDWVLSDDLRAWAVQERPDLDADSTADEFRDYWTAKPGQDGLKLDWPATWRNWVRKERGHPSNARNGRTEPGAGETPYQRHMRERMQQFAPSVAAKAPGSRAVIDVEAKDVVIPGRVG